MNKTFFKSILFVGLAVCMFSCKDDNSPLDGGNTPQGVNVEFDYSQAKLSRDAGSSATLNGSSDVDWTIEVEEGDFFSVEPMSGTAGDFKLTVTATKANTLAEKQYSKFIFNASGRKYPITVIHLEDNIRLEVSGPTGNVFTFDTDGGTNTFNVTANTEWIVKTMNAEDWIHFDETNVGKIGENMEVKVSVDPNPFAKVREGKFEVRVPESTSNEYTVTQNPAALSYTIKDGDKVLDSSTGLTGLNGAGEPRTITLNTNADWKIEAGVASDWLTFEPSEGVASLEPIKVTMNVAPNPNMNNDLGRSGTFTVTFGDGTSVSGSVEIKVEQNKGEMPADAKKLKELEEELEGGGNIDALNWSTEPDYNAWTGVEFDGNGNLIKLNLSGDVLGTNKLKGYIPEGISQFTSLKELDLSNNELTATPNLPDIEYGNESLSSGVTFKPAVPVSLIKLTNLEHLKLCGNNISGVFPSDLVAHPHYFDWKAMENIYPQKDDKADISYTYGSGTKYDKGDPSKWKLRLTSTGILRVMYYQMGGDKWTWGIGSGANQYPETAKIDAWLNNECYFSNTSYGTDSNPKIVGVSLVSSNVEAISGSGSSNIGAFSYINNLKGELPLEILMNQNIQHFRAFGSQIEGKIHPLMLQRINYLQVTNSPKIEMDIKDIAANLHPQIKNCDLSGNSGITGTIKETSLPKLSQGKTNWSDVLKNTGVTLE